MKYPCPVVTRLRALVMLVLLIIYLQFKRDSISMAFSLYWTQFPLQTLSLYEDLQIRRHQEMIVIIEQEKNLAMVL